MPRDEPRPTPQLRRPPDPLPRPQAMLDWLAGVGIGPETVETLGLYATRHRFGLDPVEKSAICFPHTIGGVVVANWLLGPGGKAQAFEELIRSPYNVDSLQDTDTAVLVQSPLEAALCVEAGYVSTITNPTADTLPNRAPLRAWGADDPIKIVYARLAAIKRFVFVYRMDETGDYFVQQWTDVLGIQRCFRAMLPTGMDALETAKAKGMDWLRQAIDKPAPAPVRGLVDIGPEDLVTYRKSPQLAKFGINLPDLDRLLCVRPKQLMVVTGNPSGGKTEWINWLSVRLSAVHGWRWAICSPEHETKQHAGSLAEKFAGEPFRDYGATTRGMTEDRLRWATDCVRRHFTWIVEDDEDAPLSLDFVLQMARAAHLRSKINGLIIDPWNEIAHQRSRDQTLDEYCTGVLRQLKMVARNHDWLIILMAHTTKIARNRDGKRPIPTLEDINGSAAFWSKSDVGVVVHRRDVNVPETDVYVQKMKLKDQGRQGSLRMRWDRFTGLYTPLQEADEATNQEELDYDR